MTSQPFRVLFVSSGNAVRSQIAEGWARALGDGRVVARSGGTRPRPLHPIATRVMQEAGVDISAQRGKSVAPYAVERFDLVVTLCESAAAECPQFPGATRSIHHPFEDPTILETQGEEDLDGYRALRDELRALVERLVEGSGG